MKVIDLDKFTEMAQAAILAAQPVMVRYDHLHIEPDHLLLALLEEKDGLALKILLGLGTDVQALQRSVQMALEMRKRAQKDDQEEVNFELEMLKHGANKGEQAGGEVSSMLPVTEKLTEVLDYATTTAGKLGEPYASIDHLLIALCDESLSGSSGRSLKKAGVTRAKILETLTKVRDHQKVTTKAANLTTTALEQFARDLTAEAGKGKLDPVIGRDQEIRRLSEVLCRRIKNNPILVGEPGIGKTAIVEGLAQRIFKGDVPGFLKDKRLFALDLSEVISGARSRGDFEERLKMVLKEVVESNGKILLFIDETHTIVGTGSSDGSPDAGNLLKPYLSRGELHCIGATTPEEYTKRIEADPDLARQFQMIDVNPTTVEQTISILRGIKSRYEAHHKVRFRDVALVAAATLSDRYITGQFLPDKAISLLDTAAARVALSMDSMPAELDEKLRRQVQLEVEREALRKESDEESRERLGRLEKELANLKEQTTRISAQWQLERDCLARIHKLSTQKQEVTAQIDEAERQNDLARAAELKYHTLAGVERELKAEQEAYATKVGDGALLCESLGDEEIADVVADWTGIQASKIKQSEAEKLLHLEDRLHERVISQNVAISAVSRAVRRARGGIKDPKRPVGSFIFLGPTGVGKTELARALAEFCFDDENAMVRFDMSEFQEKHTISRLIGSPPGYVGNAEGGELTEAVKKQPYCVVLLDEIEKAHADIFNILLQVFEDGHLTDGKGNKINFKNAILILTSNVGGLRILKFHQENPDPKAEGYDEKLAALRAEVNTDLLKQLRPELINRLDEVIMFQSLTVEDMKKIVEIQLRIVNKWVAERRLVISPDQDTKTWLAEESYEPQFGARPLKRKIQREIQDPLSEELIRGTFANGDHIGISLEPDPDATAQPRKNGDPAARLKYTKLDKAKAAA